MSNRYWPLFDLHLSTPDLRMRLMTEPDLGPIADLLPDDVEQDPAMAEYDFGDVRIGRGIASHQSYWRACGTWRPEAWRLSFVARSTAGEILGVQELEGNDFLTLRTVDSSSFLVTGARGRAATGRSYRECCDHRHAWRPAMGPDNAARDAALARLDMFTGEWVMEARFPSGLAGSGRAVFEWALGRQFLTCRTEAPGAPDAIMIMGYDPGRPPYRQHYFDSRGVARLYAMDLSDGEWTLLRDSPDFTPLHFAQRYTGTFAADGQRIDGRWESARDGSAWELDFHLSYTKAG